jgi:hypothetical protein
VARAGRHPSRNPRTFGYFCFESCAPGQSRLLAFNNLLHTRNLTQVDGVCRHSLAPTIHIRFKNYPFPPRAHNLSIRATRATRAKSALKMVLSLPTIESSTGWVFSRVPSGGTFPRVLSFCNTRAARADGPVEGFCAS